MLKRLFGLMAVFGLVMLGLAVPAYAHERSRQQVLTGAMELVLNAGYQPGSNAANADVVWTRTWEINPHRIYDIVVFSTVPPTFIGDTDWEYFAEYTALHDTGTIEVIDGMVQDFARDSYVLKGQDTSLYNVAEFWAVGRELVTDVHPWQDDFNRFRANDVGNRFGFEGEAVIEAGALPVIHGTFFVEAAVGQLDDRALTGSTTTDAGGDGPIEGRLILGQNGTEPATPNGPDGPILDGTEIAPPLAAAPTAQRSSLRADGSGSDARGVPIRKRATRRCHQLAKRPAGSLRSALVLR